MMTPLDLLRRFHVWPQRKPERAPRARLTPAEYADFRKRATAKFGEQTQELAEINTETRAITDSFVSAQANPNASE